MGLNKKQTFVRKPYDKQLYKWSPSESDKKSKKHQGTDRTFFCDATPRSNGEDWVVTYVYLLDVDSKGIQHKYAYVACDYVK
jgi:hypothetical protein